MIDSAHPFPGLPGDVVELMRSAAFSEFATVSSASVPIGTPTFCLYGPRGTLDVTTGLAYPAKAERARKNPNVGLLLEGIGNEPVVLIAGIAAVRDADLQANVDRYAAEVAAYFDSFAVGNSWEVARNAVHYWARIFVEVTPKHIWWWRNAAATDASPQRWDAPRDTVFPASDPAPAGAASAAPDWPRTAWQTQASAVIEKHLPAHLTLFGEEGFPLPFRVRSLVQTDVGFSLVLPAGVPWRVSGKASLSFMGMATFIGEVVRSKNETVFHVERTLPLLPFTQDLHEIWAPSADTHRKINARFTSELARRQQLSPRVPQRMPQPTAGSLRRAERMQRMAANQPTT